MLLHRNNDNIIMIFIFLFIANCLYIGGVVKVASFVLSPSSSSILRLDRSYDCPSSFTCDSTRISSRLYTTQPDISNEKKEYRQLKISFVTGNEMKAKEMRMILADHGATRGPDPETSMVDLKLLAVDLPEIQEISTEAVAKNKAIQGAQLAGGACVVEDTSLEFTALGGMPGPFIKWFQNKLQSQGLYNLLSAYEDKTATAVCTLAFCPYPHADPVLFTGTTKGKIIEPVVSDRGFGWDSIFVPDSTPEYNNDHGIPFASMTTEEKNKVSHRGQAVRQWADWLEKNYNELYERQSGKPAIGHKGLSFKVSHAEE